MNRLTERYKIARLIARKVSGTISEEEADELDAWVELSARHREEVTRIEGRLREDIRQGCKLNMTGEWNMFQQKFSRKRSIRLWWLACVQYSEFYNFKKRKLPCRSLGPWRIT